ncbi:MAG: hypothetical protein ACE5K8_08210, partial [Candidatus Zixiibacteriota bacterium]
VKAREALLLTLCISLLVSCSSKTELDDVGQDSTSMADKMDEAAEKEIIDRMLNETITRLRYGDKSALYENEFEYFTDEVNFDEYLERDEIKWAQADTITFLEIKNVEFFDRDSALVSLTVHFEGPTGQKSYLDDRIVVYHHKGRWIKPTVTVIDLQLDYEEKIRVADSAAAAEAAEEGLD